MERVSETVNDYPIELGTPLTLRMDAERVQEDHCQPNYSCLSMAAMSAEKTYFTDNTISVTSTRIIATGTTYPLSGITAVSWQKHVIGGKVMGWFMMILSFIIGLPSLLGGVYLMALICLGIFVWGLMKVRKPNYYSIVVSTAGQQGEIFANTSHDYIQQIVEAINQAIIERG